MMSFAQSYSKNYNYSYQVSEFIFSLELKNIFGGLLYHWEFAEKICIQCGVF